MDKFKILIHKKKKTIYILNTGKLWRGGGDWKSRGICQLRKVGTMIVKLNSADIWDLRLRLVDVNVHSNENKGLNVLCRSRLH